MLLSFVIILLDTITVSADGLIYKRNGERRHWTAMIDTKIYADNKVELHGEKQLDAPAEALYKVCNNYEFFADI